MEDIGEQAELRDAAAEIFDLTRLSWTLQEAGQGSAKGRADLTETEFLALDQLAQCESASLTVGEIQRRIRVRPAQMSRIVRSLETRAGRPLIRCRINPRDKRRVDVSLTEAGRRVHAAFRDARLAATIDMVTQLSPKDRAELMRILRIIRTHISNRLSENSGHDV